MASSTSKPQPLVYPLPNRPMVPIALASPSTNLPQPLGRHIGQPLGSAHAEQVPWAE
jgi:hypothetical protein